jgi:dynein heavy chain
LESLNTQKETTAVQLERADKLVNGLADESQRWVESEERLGVELVNLIGNMMISAGFVSYVGPFTSTYRISLLEGWMKFAGEQKIPYSSDLSIKDQLGDPVVIREWEQNSLPADALSTENGIICAAASRWPLLIDPQSQGNKWIKRMEKDNNIQAIKPSNPKMLTIIENGCKMGYPVLLENIEETLDPSLNPIMEKNIKKDKGIWKIKLSGGWEDYSPDFKFQLTTKLGNPHYLPEVCIKVTLINFTVTPQGLED